MLALAESLVYETDAATAQHVEKMAASYAASVTSLGGDALENKKGEITNVTKAFQYLAKSNVVPKDFAPLAALDKIVKAQGWDQPPGKQNAKKKKQ